MPTIKIYQQVHKEVHDFNFYTGNIYTSTISTDNFHLTKEIITNVTDFNRIILDGEAYKALRKVLNEDGSLAIIIDKPHIEKTEISNKLLQIKSFYDKYIRGKIKFEYSSILQSITEAYLFEKYSYFYMYGITKELDLGIDSDSVLKNGYTDNVEQYYNDKLILGSKDLLDFKYFSSDNKYKDWLSYGVTKEKLNKVFGKKNVKYKWFSDEFKITLDR
jgi:hypothetical protein